tara:strand:- start:5 stop:322 length:318 start_codon:yes stop_codon:yes gene_type:complete
MSAYFILTQTITDLDAFRRDYIPKVMPILEKHGGEVLVASFDATPLEGDPAQAAVVIRFPPQEAIIAFDDDPEYQPAKSIRHDLTTNANAVKAPAFEYPSRETAR